MTSAETGELSFTDRRRAQLAAALGPTSEHLFPAAYTRPVVSPDGTMLAWISDRDGRPRAYAALLPPSGPVEQPALPLDTEVDPDVTCDVRALSWSPDGTYIACEVVPGGGERSRVLLLSPSGACGASIGTNGACGASSSTNAACGADSGTDGTQRREVAEGSTAVTLGAWSPTGRQLGITIYSEDGAAGAATTRGWGLACLFDVRDGSSTVLGSGPAAVVCAVSGDGRRAVLRTGRRGARTLELIDLWTGRRTDLLTGDATVANCRFGVTGGVLYLHTDAGRERPALLALTFGEGDEVSLAYEVAAREDADLDLVALDPAGARAALAWNIDGYSELELLDLRSGFTEPLNPFHRAGPTAGPTGPEPNGQVKQSDRQLSTAVRGQDDQGSLPRPAGQVITDLAFTRDGRALLVAHEGSAVPKAIARLTFGLAGEGEQGPAAELSALLPAEPDADARTLIDQLVTPELCRFAAEDGLALSGWLFRPRGAFGPLPTLLWLHGGPEAQERPVFQPLFQALVGEGIQVFAPNVRGSTGYGRAFAGADDLARRFTAITDVRAAVSFLVGAGLAEAERVGVAGRSYGGYLTLVALAWFPELFRVGVDVCGMADLETFYAETEPWIAVPATTKYGDPVSDRALLYALSPIHRADRIAAPLLVVHGAYDTNVPLGEARQIVETLAARGATVHALVFDDEGHETHALANRVRFVGEVVSWVGAALSEASSRSA